MAWNFFKKDKDKEDPEMDINDLVLSKMKPGFLVDYDMKTYQVIGKNYYQWEEGNRTLEWELKQGSEVLYLERDEEDGEVSWSLSRKMAIGTLDGKIADYIIENEDPPETVIMDGVSFYFEEDDIGTYHKGDNPRGLQFVVWDYSDDRQEKSLSIEQWGETKFDVTVGFEVEEYQFSNILPGAN